MPVVSRRSFLAASAAAAASPALGAVPASGEVDVAIVGAGAAGIAAARRVAAAKRRFALVEASDHIGGRCVTDTRTFGVPFDRGAHWIHMPDINPVAQLAPQAGIDIYAAPPGQKVRIGRRYAREGEMEDFLSQRWCAPSARSTRRRASGDISCAQALPKDLGDWQRDGRVRARPVRLRQGSRRCFGARFCAIGGARHRCVLPHRLWRVAGQARRAICQCNSQRR